QADGAHSLANDRLARAVEARIRDTANVDLVSPGAQAGGCQHRQSVEYGFAAAGAEAAGLGIRQIDDVDGAAEPVEGDALLAGGHDDVGLWLLRRGRRRYGRQRGPRGRTARGG